MKIAQIAPLMERVPPKLYGGTERIVSYLADALVAQGHDVTLFASSDSITAARLVPCTAQALRLNPAVRDPIPHYMVMLDKVRSMADEFDILHFRIDQFHFPIFRDQASRSLTTLHGRQDLPDLRHLYEGFPEMPLVSVSEAQRRPIADANFVATVPHGIPRDLLAPALIARGGYLAFLGRISPEKRVDRAITIARAVGLPLKIAAKVDRVDEAYFRSEIAPLLDQPGIEFIGEIDALDRGRVRRRFEQRFNADRMAQDYLKVYARLVVTRVGREDRRRRRVPASRSTVASLPPEATSQVATLTPTATSHQRPSLIAPKGWVK
jgi:glycosyltransferase involved in cell wall biosynthesis